MLACMHYKQGRRLTIKTKLAELPMKSKHLVNHACCNAFAAPYIHNKNLQALCLCPAALAGSMNSMSTAGLTPA